MIIVSSNALLKSKLHKVKIWRTTRFGSSFALHNSILSVTKKREVVCYVRLLVEIGVKFLSFDYNKIHNVTFKFFK